MRRREPGRKESAERGDYAGLTRGISKTQGMPLIMQKAVATEALFPLGVSEI